MIQSTIFLAMAQPHSINSLMTLWEKLYEANVINTIFVLIFLYWICKKVNIFAGLEDKLQNIKLRIMNAEEDKSRSEQELETTKKQVANSDTVVRKIEKEAKEVADSLSKNIINEASMESENLEKNSERIIKGEEEMASLHLTNSVTKAAFNIAEEHVKQAIDDRLHKKYINEFIDGLDNLKV
ncbi:MAG: hypothetical protein PHC34_06845 [Candidatus Gastranaerophilales bacterium]|nr:hypothetical protein [Candidatus Gastranaerophilales bacterium]